VFAIVIDDGDAITGENLSYDELYKYIYDVSVHVLSDIFAYMFISQIPDGMKIGLFISDK
jgi:hypothetical protein